PQAREVVVPEPDHTGAGSTQPRQQAQQAGLARSVGAEQADHGARTGFDADPVDDDAVANGPGHARGGEVHTRTLRRRRTSAKAGTPSRAVATPTGSSCGAITVRAAVSTHTRNTLPLIAASGSIRRWFTPTIARATCGRTRPT